MKIVSNAEKGSQITNNVSNVSQKGVKCQKGSQITDKVSNVE